MLAVSPTDRGSVMVDIVDVVLVDAGLKKTDVILAMREITCDERVVKLMDLREAKRRIDTAPCVAIPSVPRDAGERMKARLERAGAIDFRKLKAPFVWYDLLPALNVLSRLPWLSRDPRLQDMVNVLWSKADDGGRFTPESVWTPWKGWEFGQKREPSRWVTLMAWCILRRLADGSVPNTS
jgi:hypothetical protein